MYIDHHPIFGRSLVQVLYAGHTFLGIIFPEINLDTFDTPASPSLECSIHILVTEILAVDKS